MKQNSTRLMAGSAPVWIILITLLAVACSKTKEIAKVEQLEKIELPFSDKDYRTDSEFLRFVQMHESSDLSTAKSRALMKAQAGIAQTANVLVKSVMYNYVNERKIDAKNEFNDKYNAITELVIKEQLTNTRIIGETVLKDKESGRYTYYVALEMAADELLNKSVNGITRNERLRQDFEEERFRKIFETEMNKLETPEVNTVNQ
ncbi:MAG: hypothetical protein IPL22_22795 [Bacteroidetes bacterium]|nr:hypothetical protein [Bacteroidota bacterium]